jgi:hypothetical protein
LPSTNDTTPLPDVPRWLSIWMVPAIPLVIAVSYFASRSVYSWLRLKEGPVEFVTVGVLLIGIWAGFRTWRHRSLLPARWVRRWVIVLPLGLIYFAGEELSWGQHVFKWEAPDAIKQINKQDETNLHNLGPHYVLFGRRPKQVVEIWSIVGCIIVPLWRQRKRIEIDPKGDPWYWFWPTKACMLAAIFATLVYLPTRIARPFYEELPGDLRFSELQEYYFAYVLTLYVLSISIRLGAVAKRGSTSE